MPFLELFSGSACRVSKTRINGVKRLRVVDEGVGSRVHEVQVVFADGRKQKMAEKEFFADKQMGYGNEYAKSEAEKQARAVAVLRERSDREQLGLEIIPSVYLYRRGGAKGPSTLVMPFLEGLREDLAVEASAHFSELTHLRTALDFHEKNWLNLSDELARKVEKPHLFNPTPAEIVEHNQLLAAKRYFPHHIALGAKELKRRVQQVQQKISVNAELAGFVEHMREQRQKASSVGVAPHTDAFLPIVEKRGGACRAVIVDFDCLTERSKLPRKGGVSFGKFVSQPF